MTAATPRPASGPTSAAGSPGRTRSAASRQRSAAAACYLACRCPCRSRGPRARANRDGPRDRHGHQHAVARPNDCARRGRGNKPHAKAREMWTRPPRRNRRPTTRARNAGRAQRCRSREMDRIRCRIRIGNRGRARKRNRLARRCVPGAGAPDPRVTRSPGSRSADTYEEIASQSRRLKVRIPRPKRMDVVARSTSCDHPFVSVRTTSRDVS